LSCQVFVFLLAVNSSSYFSLVMLCTSNFLLALQLIQVQGTSVCERTLHKSGCKCTVHILSLVTELMAVSAEQVWMMKFKDGCSLT
jgi:hypothetical protein